MTNQSWQSIAEQSTAMLVKLMAAHKRLVAEHLSLMVEMEHASENLRRASELIRRLTIKNNTYCNDCFGMVAGENGIPSDFRCCHCDGTGIRKGDVPKEQQQDSPGVASWMG